SSPFIQLDKMNWHFPQDMQVPYTINFDNGHRDFVGVSKIHPATGITVLLTGAMEDGNAFLDDFSHSETMTINFDNGKRAEVECQNGWQSRCDESVSSLRQGFRRREQASSYNFPRASNPNVARA